MEMSKHVELVNLIRSPIGIIGLVSLGIVVGFISYAIYWNLKDPSNKGNVMTRLLIIMIVLSGIAMLESIIVLFASIVTILVK